MPKWRSALILFVALAAAAAKSVAQNAAPSREGFAEVPDVRLWYTDTGGGGVPVIFLHAATGTTRSWEKQVAAFSAANYRCITYDRRGWGRSVTQASGPQPGTAADDLLALMDYLHVDRAHLVGTAAGGLVSLDFALSFPQRVRSVTIANNGGTSVQEAEFQEMSKRLLPEGFDALPAEFRELSPAYRAAEVDGLRRWIEIAKASRQDPSAKPQPVRHPLTKAVLESLKTPALIMTGAADLHAPPPMMRLYAAAIKGSESLVVPEAGHSAYWEQPEIFNRAVLQFIAKH